MKKFKIKYNHLFHNKSVLRNVVVSQCAHFITELTRGTNDKYEMTKSVILCVKTGRYN